MGKWICPDFKPKPIILSGTAMGRPQLGLSKLMAAQLKHMAATGRAVAWASPSIRALHRRGLVHYASDDNNREGWVLTEAGREWAVKLLEMGNS
jgi:hypothetical protein